MSEEAETPTCPTLIQLLAQRASNPIVTFGLGMIAAQGGPKAIEFFRALIGA